MEKVLNIGIVAHVDAGKTTLTEHILFESGVIRAKGRVDHASAVTDDLAVERRRGITIKEKTVSFRWGEARFNLLDTPGHADFLCEVVRALNVLDVAVLVISAKEGVQPQTVAIYNLLAGMGLPVVIFINKLDRVGADVAVVRKDMAALGMNHVMMRCADEAHALRHWRENADYAEDNLLTLAEFDDGVIARFEDGQDVDGVIFRLAAEGMVVPVFMGVALQGIGVRDLLDGLGRLPMRTPPPDAPVSAIVYKIHFNERGERKVFFRLFAGTVRVREKYGIAQKPDAPHFQLKTLETLRGAKATPVPCVSAGEIGILTGVEGLQVGDIIGAHCEAIRTVADVKPIFSAYVTAAKRADRRRLLDALGEMQLEDRNLNVLIEDENTTLHLYGEIQKEFIKTQLLEKYGIEANFSETRTVFRETPRGVGKAGAGLVGFTVTPLPKGTGVRYETDRATGATGGLTTQMYAAVKEAALASLVPGALIVEEDGVGVPFRSGVHGWEVTDIRVVFDSCILPPGPRPSAGDFRAEAPYALRGAIWNAGTQLLEPIYVYEIVAQAALCGQITNVITQHEGTVTAIEDSAAYMKIKGRLPARLSQQFMLQFQSITKNMGRFDVAEVEYTEYER